MIPMVGPNYRKLLKHKVRNMTFSEIQAASLMELDNLANAMNGMTKTNDVFALYILGVNHGFAFT